MRRALLSLVLGVALVFGLLGAVVLTTESSEAGQAAPSRVIDQTFLCSAARFAGIRVALVQAYAGVRDNENPSKWRSLPFVGISKSVGIRATASGPTPEYQGVGAPVPTGVGVSKMCRPTKTRIPFSRRGLDQGGAAGPFGDIFECAIPRQVQIRLRAVFSSPTELKFERKHESLQTRVHAREVRIGMRTAAGRPIAFAEAFESGRARIFVAGNCIPD
jgi:hypothetical protein